MSYIEIVKSEDGITLKLTPAGREEINAYRTEEGEWDRPHSEILFNLLEDHLETGWEFIQPEEIGALTSAPILSDDISRDDKGEITEVGSVDRKSVV
jgi:hypothetical protein